jgi:hypothetical protein
MPTAVQASFVLGYFIIVPALVPCVFRWMTVSIIYHHHDSTGMNCYCKRYNPDDVDGRNNSLVREKQAVYFFLKGKLERWRGEK